MEILAARNLINLDTVLFFPFRYLECCNSRSRSVSIDFVHLHVKATLSTPLTPFQTLIPCLIDRRRTGQQMAKIVEKSHLNMLHVLTSVGQIRKNYISVRNLIEIHKGFACPR